MPQPTKPSLLIQQLGIIIKYNNKISQYEN